MADQKRPIVAVHGVGVGTDADRADFSLELARGVAQRRRRVTRVGPLPEGRVPRDVETSGVRWEEALWESEHDTEDAVVKALLTGLGATPAALTRLTSLSLDLLLDVPLYLTESGTRIRRRVRSVIAAHPGCVVVAHSLGSVISADVLSRSFSSGGTPLDVAGFVTMGSPLNLLGLRVPLRRPFPFTWENFHYRADPICFGGALDEERFPDVSNHELSRDEGYGIAHTHYWASPIVANSIRRMSRRGE